MLFDVAQIGARLHYATAEVLESAGRLGTLYTDLYAPRLVRRVAACVPVRYQPDVFRRFLSRVPTVPADRVVALNRFGLEYKRRRLNARTLSELTDVYVWCGRTFCRSVLEERRYRDRAVYTFNSAAMELLEAVRTRGQVGILEQTGLPLAVQRRLLREEQELYPAWLPEMLDAGAERAYTDRERAEWAFASLIICPSDAVARAVAESGGPPNRCAVIPYGYDSAITRVDRCERRGRLRVLTVGSVSLAKGSQYVLQVARELKAVAEFRIVGQVLVPPRIVASMAREVDVVGPVPRSEVANHYRWADVFLLPSLYEGSATVTYEAMAAGLPVVCTPNTGSVVRDGIEGYLVPSRDRDLTVARLLSLATDGDRRRSMSSAALARAKMFTLEQYGRRLTNVLTRCAGSL